MGIKQTIFTNHGTFLYHGTGINLTTFAYYGMFTNIRKRTDIYSIGHLCRLCYTSQRMYAFSLLNG